MPFSASAEPGISVYRITGDNGYTDEAASFLMTCLGKMSGIRAVEREKLSDVFIEQQFIDAGIVDDEDAEYMQAVGVDYVLVGELDCSGKLVNGEPFYEAILNLRLLSVHDGAGRVVWSGSDHSTGSNITSTVNEAAYDCMRSLYEIFPQQGYVFKKEGKSFFIDVGIEDGIKKGMIFYAKLGGKTVTSPRTGKQMVVSDKQVELKVVKVFSNYCVAEATEKDGTWLPADTPVYKKIAGKPRILGMLWSGEVKF